MTEDNKGRKFDLVDRRRSGEFRDLIADLLFLLISDRETTF
jgi:hypothetical protein